MTNFALQASADVSSKFVIGADGARSTVRRVAGIPFEERETAHTWVRMDGIFRTNMPDAYTGGASLESSTHGSVRWFNLDHGRVRIGYILTTKVLEGYAEGMTEADVKIEAIKAMAPFTLDIETVDWYSIYE